MRVNDKGLRTFFIYKLAGDYVFSTTLGAKPISGFGKMKDTIDAEMKKLGKLVPWRLHDLRRTMRTRLPSHEMPIDDPAPWGACVHHEARELRSRRRRYSLFTVR